MRRRGWPWRGGRETRCTAFFDFFTFVDVCIIAHLLIEGYSFEYVNAYHSVSRAEPRADVRELDESVSSPVRRVTEVAPGACPV